ncbi:hormonally up-regulated neu tumor-associated kinase [Lingula anatina]|uniref:non-specific serine/threonine protein kinase n=1 Tax=Lingula anatina TaxID=7574 RepID=A0A1S3IZ28_LINAN|nr:hormonally up-regulated neu tumor-associated kinase [Lingula anatina]|eukprot:XP_013403241.1 hormonally up-regulated neu tumor-associated kinase [Lingula anatina]
MRPPATSPPEVLGVRLKPKLLAPPVQPTLPLPVTHISQDLIREFPHTKKVGNYLIGKTLGRGSFAKVKLGLHLLTGEKVAVKCIDKKKTREDSYVRKHLRREGKIMSLLRHPHIVQLYEVMETPNTYYLVTELCQGGDLMDHIVSRGRLSEKEVRLHMRHVVSALDHMHKAGVIHRDLKIENFLLDEKKEIKIIDFGLSNCFLNSGCHDNRAMAAMCSTQCGSPAYAAPELLAQKRYGPQVDVWGMGVNMYAMLTGNLPFSCEPFNIKNLLVKMLNGEMNPVPGHVSKGCKDFLTKLLVPDPNKRMTLEQAMIHPWLSESDIGNPLPLISRQHHKLCSQELSEKILQYMCTQLGCKLGETIKMVTCNIPHSSTSTYHLLTQRLARHQAETEVNGKIAAAERKMTGRVRAYHIKRAPGMKDSMTVPHHASPRCSTPKQPSPEMSKQTVSMMTTGQLLDHLYYPRAVFKGKPVKASKTGEESPSAIFKERPVKASKTGEETPSAILKERPANASKTGEESPSAIFKERPVNASITAEETPSAVLKEKHVIPSKTEDESLEKKGVVPFTQGLVTLESCKASQDTLPNLVSAKSEETETNIKEIPSKADLSKQITHRFDRWRYKKNLPSSKPLIKVATKSANPTHLSGTNGKSVFDEPVVTVSPFICPRSGLSSRGRRTSDPQTYWTSHDFHGGERKLVSSQPSQNGGKYARNSTFNELPEVVKKYSTLTNHEITHLKKRLKSPRY